MIEQQLGRPLRRDEQVHHRNRDRLDNRPENLEVLSAKDHSALHNQKHPTVKACAVCGATFEPAPTKRARAKLCGKPACRSIWQRANALAREAKRRGETPPVMDWIVQQCAATLAPELAGRIVP